MNSDAWRMRASSVGSAPRAQHTNRAPHERVCAGWSARPGRPVRAEVGLTSSDHVATATGTGPSTGTLVSLNVGLPRDVQWDGRVVHTGIWKDPVEGRRMVRRLNVDGDGQGDRAGHGGVNRAVFVYQLDSYRYWEQVLGRDDLTYGQFGENFTVVGLADDEVCIGDRYRIGSAVFEVSAPRVTCYRVGIRMDEPRMPALLVAHRRPGFYLRVLEEGEVGAGDEIERLGRGPEAMTVAEVDGLLYLPGHARRDLMRALRIPALSVGWQGSFREMLERAPDGAAPRSWRGLGCGRCASPPSTTRARTVISVRLVPLDGEPAVPGAAGAVPHRATASRPVGAAAPAHLLAVGPSGHRQLPHQREARTRTAGRASTSTPSSASATSSRRARRGVRSCCARPTVRSC